LSLSFFPLSPISYLLFPLSLIFFAGRGCDHPRGIHTARSALTDVRRQPAVKLAPQRWLLTARRPSDPRQRKGRRILYSLCRQGYHSRTWWQKEAFSPDHHLRDCILNLRTPLISGRGSWR
jgi:hypothetical protein